MHAAGRELASSSREELASPAEGRSMLLSRSMLSPLSHCGRPASRSRRLHCCSVVHGAAGCCAPLVGMPLSCGGGGGMVAVGGWGMVPGTAG